jgi:hypothetical protein
MAHPPDLPCQRVAQRALALNNRAACSPVQREPCSSR